jgi:hypothetical protein
MRSPMMCVPKAADRKLSCECNRRIQHAVERAAHAMRNRIMFAVRLPRPRLAGDQRLSRHSSDKSLG